MNATKYVLVANLFETSNARLRSFRYSFDIQMHKGLYKTKHYYRLFPEASFGLRVLSLPVSVCVYQSLACPHDNSSPVQARITTFGPEKQNTLFKNPIVFFVLFFFGGGQLILTFKVKFNFKLKIDPILSLSKPLLTTHSS